MARIRTVKPSFWTDGKIVRLSPFARLFYIGCWNFALCDLGHLPDDPFELKLQILPADDVDAADLVEELLQAGRLRRISVGGQQYLQAHRLADHQKTDKRWDSRCPACSGSQDEHPTDAPEPSETPPEPASLPETPPDSPDHTETPPDSAQESKGKEGKGREEEKNSPRAPRSARASPAPDRFDDFWAVYPRKEDKGHARKAWPVALRKAGGLAEPIIAAAAGFAEHARRARTERRFVPLPATWLNGERWQDEPPSRTDVPAYWQEAQT